MHLGQVPSHIERKFPALHLIGVDVSINPHGRFVGILAGRKISNRQGQDISPLHRLSNGFNFGNLGMRYCDFLHQIPKPFGAVIAVPSDFNFWSMRRADGPKVVFLLRIYFKRA